jgi:uncharacterized protein (TIGR02996 family)
VNALPSEVVSYLRTLPDDWPSWLVYADALSECGDERGELLVRAHRRDTGTDRGTRGGPRAAQGCVDGEAGRSASADDLDRYDGCRRLASLAERAPFEDRSVFARPLSQLLALLEPGQVTTADVSPVFELHYQQIVAAVLDWIWRAFDGGSAPDEDHYTLHQAQAAANYDTCDRSRDFLGRWQELPAEQLLANQWALAHLDDQGHPLLLACRHELRLADLQHPADG